MYKIVHKFIFFLKMTYWIWRSWTSYVADIKYDTFFIRNFGLSISFLSPGKLHDLPQYFTQLCFLGRYCYEPCCLPAYCKTATSALLYLIKQTWYKEKWPLVLYLTYGFSYSNIIYNKFILINLIIFYIIYLFY